MRLFIAIVLTLFTPGLGQYVNGQRLKGFVFIGLTLVGIILENTISVIPSYIVTLAALIDAVVVGLKIRRGQRGVPTGRKFVLEVAILTVLSYVIVSYIEGWIVQSNIQSIKEELNEIGKPSEEEKQKVKREAEQYLKERYGEEFYVDDLNYIWQTDSWDMRGHLKSEEGWDFWVTKDDGQFKDAYFTHRISRDARKEIKPQIEKAFDSIINWKSSVSVAEEIENKYAKSIPSYRELRQNTQRYRQIIQIALATSLTEKNQKQEFEEVYRLVSYLNQKNIRAQLLVFYYDPTIKETGIREVDFTKLGDYQDYSTATLEIKDVSKVKTIKDIQRYLIK